MATKKKPEEEPTQALTTVDDVRALANVDFGDDAGGGQSNMGAADQAIPFLSILQALSKVIADPTKKVEGAQPGMIMDSVSKRLYNTADGEGITFLPCNSSGQVFVEWKGEPGSGTPVGRFLPNDPVVLAAQRKYAFNELKTEAGNRLVETFYVAGYILDDDLQPIGAGIISFKSTSIKPYKESIGELYKIPGGAPLYAFPLVITTQPETRPKGTAFNYVIKPRGYDGNVFLDGVPGCFIHPQSEEGQRLYPLGRKLSADIDSGTANIHTEGEGAHGGDGASTEDEPY